MTNDCVIDCREVGTRITIEDDGIGVAIKIEDNAQKATILFKTEEFLDKVDDLITSFGEKTRNELEDENLMLKERLADKDDYIEQLEEEYR